MKNAYSIWSPKSVPSLPTFNIVKPFCNEKEGQEVLIQLRVKLTPYHPWEVSILLFYLLGTCKLSQLERRFWWNDAEIHLVSNLVQCFCYWIKNEEGRFVKRNNRPYEEQ